MSKTEQTKKIEECLASYYPATVCGIEINKFRPRHMAFEVPIECGTVSGGLVDCMRVDEYFADIRYEDKCRFHGSKEEPESHYIHGYERSCNCLRNYPEGEKPEFCTEKDCRGHSRIRTLAEPSILVTCYEIKISKYDFQSPHGHNFVGNCNYYVMPAELYKQVKDQIEPGVGVILCDGVSGPRKKVECEFRKLDVTTTMWLVMSLFKRMEKSTWKTRFDLEDGTIQPCSACMYTETCEKKMRVSELDTKTVTKCGLFQWGRARLWTDPLSDFGVYTPHNSEITQET